jgi:hypothetical protein
LGRVYALPSFIKRRETMELENYEYYITKDDVLDNSEFTEPELSEVFGDKIDFYLKDISSKVYSIIYSAYRGVNKDKQYKGIRHLINNDTNKIAVLQKAIIEYIRGEMAIGMGLNLYMGKKHYSDEIINILKRGDLWIVAELTYNDEDIDES